MRGLLDGERLTISDRKGGDRGQNRTEDLHGEDLAQYQGELKARRRGKNGLGEYRVSMKREYAKK